MTLNEIFQDSYPYTWREAGIQSMASFRSHKSGDVDVEFFQDDDAAEVTFSTYDAEGWTNYALTNHSDHLMILSTVIKIIKDYIDKKNISKIQFEAKGDSRVKVYSYIARRFSKLYNFSINTLKDDEGYGDLKFELVKNEA